MSSATADQSIFKALSLSNAWILALSQYKNEMRASKLYVVWPILFPTCYTLLFVALKPLFMNIQLDALSNYALFVFTGFSLWQTWIESLKLQIHAVKTNKSMLAQSGLNTTTLFAANLCFLSLQLATKLLAIIVFSILLVDTSLLAYVMLVGFSFIILLNGAVIGLVLQPIATLYSDVSKIIQSISLALILSAGVVFEVPSDLPEHIYTLLSINPLGPLLDTARHMLIGKEKIFYISSYIWIGLTLLLTLPLLHTAKKTLPILLERIGA